MQKFLYIFRRMAGNGRAWKVKDQYTYNTITAILAISKKVREMFKQIPQDAYPWSCSDNAIPYWERYFGLAPEATATLEERRQSVITEYTAIGSNAAEYLEYILSGNDYDAQVVENLNGDDIGGTWDAVKFKIANGVVATYATDESPAVKQDPIQKPTTTKQWKKVYILYSPFDTNSVNTLRRLVLKYSSSHTVALLINNDPNSTIWDADLVSSIIQPINTVDAELVQVPQDAQFVIDAELA
jgi:hypothetical protein